MLSELKENFENIEKFVQRGDLDDIHRIIVESISNTKDFSYQVLKARAFLHNLSSCLMFWF